MSTGDYSVFSCHPDQPSIEWCDLFSIIQKAFEAGELALIVGSGVSQMAPANVPAGENIVKYLMERLLSTYPQDLQDLNQKIKQSIEGIPFEVLMARLSELDADLAQKIVVMLTHIESGQSNVLHKQIRRLLERATDLGVAFPVITSNYDLGIADIQQSEDFFSRRSRIPVVITEDQTSRTTTTREIFHIHGANIAPTSLVFDYKQEFKLEKWKRDYLKSIMQNKFILILGFSGKDLDICRALVDCTPQGIVWFRSREESCQVNSWTLDAQKLVARVKNSYAVNTHGKLQYALAALLHDDLLTLPALRIDEKEIESRFHTIEQAYPIQLQLWARWMGLRAGFWRLADGITQDERDLLSEQQLLEIQAFGHYYAGRHLSGARLLHKAGKEAIKAEPPVRRLERYIYFCNTEVEYLNRGAFTLHALATTLRVSLSVVWRMVIHHDKMTAGAQDEYKNLLGSFVTMWPFLPILLSSDMFGTWPGKMIRPLLRWLLRPVEDADLDKFITILATMSTPDSQEFREVQEQYRWLGQQARRINLYRLSALRQLHVFYSRPSHETQANLDKLKEIYAMADLATYWAQNIGDPCRTAKSTLVCLEILRAIAAYSPDANFLESLANEAHIRSSNGSIPISSIDAWGELSTGEVSPWCMLPVRAFYTLVERGKRMFHKRIRLLALSFLETS